MRKFEGKISSYYVLKLCEVQNMFMFIFFTTFVFLRDFF